MNSHIPWNRNPTRSDEKGQIIRPKGNLQNEAVVTPSLEKAVPTITTTLEGLGDVLVLRTVVTLDRLATMRTTDETTPKTAGHDMLRRYWERHFDPFFDDLLRGSPNGVALHTRDPAAFTMRKQQWAANEWKSRCPLHTRQSMAMNTKG